jgi:monovalent cation/hydrogen antiporter
MDSVATIGWVVSFVVVAVTVTGLSRRVGWSAPVALVAVGAVVSFLPGLPRIEVEPDLILYGLLPPLLFAAAVRTSLVDVRARRDSILALSVGLVAFTVLVVGLAAWLVIPAISLAAAFAFGAVVAPTDAVAVTAVAGRLPLPRRLVTVLEGESLLNDATALVALNAAIAAIVSLLNPWAVVGGFGLAVGVGIAFGLAIGFVLSAIRQRLRSPVLDTSLALVTPYLAFIPTQLLHGSGVLAVVIAGLYLGYRSPIIQSAEARIAEALNWKTIGFLLENAVFLFIGLSLSGILEGVVQSGPGMWETVGICLVILLALLVSRFIWVIVLTALYRFGPRRLRQQSWSWRNGIAVGFAGIRGVVTLAAVFLLPPETPARSFLQFLAFVVVAGTLLEGLALPWIIRRLRLPPPNFTQEEVEAQLLLAEARAAGGAQLDADVTDADEDRVVTRLRLNATFLAEAMEHPSPDEAEPLPTAYRRLRTRMIAAERTAVLAARQAGRYQDRAVRAVIASIDAEEIALKASEPTEPGADLT